MQVSTRYNSVGGGVDILPLFFSSLRAVGAELGRFAELDDFGRLELWRHNLVLYVAVRLAAPI